MEYISFYSSILPILSYLLSLKKNKSTILWVIFVYVIFSFSTDLSILTINYKVFPNIRFTIYSIFTISEYCFFSYFVYKSLDSLLFKKAIIFLSIAFFLSATITYFRTLGKQEFDDFTTSVEGILLILYCLSFFFEQISSQSAVFLYEKYSFWIITGILLYFAGSLFLFVLGNSLSKQEIKVYWDITYVANVIKNILFALAFFMKKEDSPNTPMRKPYSIR